MNEQLPLDLDVTIARVAATQLGVITQAQLNASGATPYQIRRRARIGALVPVGPGVFRLTGAPSTWEQSLLAVQLGLGEQSWISHRSAAALYGFDGFPKRPVEVTVMRDRRGVLASAEVHTTTRLEPIDRFVVPPFACTSASRTIIDLARTCSAGELERAIDSALRDGWSSVAFLARRLAALRGSGRNGVRLLDDVLVDAGGHSWLERRFLRLVRVLGLPRPRCQVVFAKDGAAVARVDFHFDPLPLVIEVSGRKGHSTDLERQRDAQRRNELQSLGRVVLEFTRADVIRRPEYVERMLRFHLTRPSMSRMGRAG